jgi:MYXO-CTERM domain-containing protein
MIHLYRLSPAVVMLCFAFFTGGQNFAWASSHAVTSIAFEQSVLDNLNAAVEAAGTASPQLDGQTGFAAVNAATLSFVTPGGDFEGFTAGELQHTGELLLRVGERELVLSNFVLRVAADPVELDLFDAAGRRRFSLEAPQPYVRNGELHLQNVDVTIAPELAEELGRPELEGAFIGNAHVRLPAQSTALGALPAGTGQCADAFTSDRDVALLSLGRVSQLDREAGGRVSLTLAAVLKNVGTSAILWKEAIEPDGLPENVGEHPYLVLHVYRIQGGRIKQIGRSDVKHAFFSTNAMCPCPGAHVIYPDCEDTYGATTNANRVHLGPREEVSVATGAWNRIGSHFDAVPVDDTRDHGNDMGEHDAYEHRLTVHEAELQQGGQFFVEGWYIIRDDVELFNSMGNYPISPSLDGVWTFGPDAPISRGSILDRLVDPDTPSPRARIGLLDTGEGRLQLAVVSTDLGGGQFHHEYALLNFDFDRQIRAFEIELQSGVNVSNVEFVDVDRDTGNDWPVTMGNPTLTWNAPPGNEMDWGTLYSFAFDANAESIEVTVTVHAAEAGGAASFAIQAASVVGSDDADDGDSASGSALWPALAALLLAAWHRKRRAKRAGAKPPG